MKTLSLSVLKIAVTLSLVMMATSAFAKDHYGYAKEAAVKAFKANPQVKAAIAEGLQGMGDPATTSIIVQPTGYIEYNEHRDQSNFAGTITFMVIQNLDLLAEHWEGLDSVIALVTVDGGGKNFKTVEVRMIKQLPQTK
jgi:hypothetical protein